MQNKLKQKTIAIIPARGGSKRFPGKNIRLLNGLSLIVHSINYAKANSGLIDNIIVSTDDEEIKQIALAENVDVIDRPATISDDHSTTLSALKHVVDNLKERVENIVLLQPTNPLRPKNLLRDAFQEFQTGEYESLMTVSSSHKKLGKIEENRFSPFNYKIGQRSQDLEPLYFENGLLYIIKADIIIEGRLLGDKNLPFIINHPYASVDIDYQQDLEYAEFLMKKGE
ncbi:acylneuraminate cytidylyltransferase family protein [Gillisia sp. M10.2A]|uniref:Acylneuraminate cytidylyltransferase family protein n=1 Tax=Gillisia lutea TaxID=2909668 RepID=A0ABS9EGZ8_9FLAO|nr:acylneuraminate cytidylyltransferase family protein [Gillisia lutea]MCF4102126.1 acylneuraminate cytidylyltransferase family protein [Gillisia lutea]